MGYPAACGGEVHYCPETEKLRNCINSSGAFDNFIWFTKFYIMCLKISISLFSFAMGKPTTLK